MSPLLPILAVCVFAARLANADVSPLELEFEHRKMQELVDYAGYPLEEHFAETGDGYVLAVYRIPGGADWRSAVSVQGGQRPVVLLQHGLLDSSATWVLNRPNQSLGFLLADAGFDVWLGNSRGNAFSRNHTGISPDSAAFWDYTFDDMAAYDLPAMVDYVLQATGAEQLAYIGHSQGCTQAFAALSGSPRLRSQLNLFVALAPAVYLRYVSSVPLLMLAQLDVDQLFLLFGGRELLPARKATADIFSELCRSSPPTCVSILTLICGFNENNLNLTRLPTYVAYAPSGTSVKNMAHWAQLVRQSAEQRRALFRRYDYGAACTTAAGMPRTCNRNVYGSNEAPAYNLTAVAGVPVAVFHGVQDKLADPVDVESLVEALPEGTVVFTHSELSFEHLDFTWGLSSAERVYPHVLDLLARYSEGKWGAVGRQGDEDSSIEMVAAARLLASGSKDTAAFAA